MEAGWSCLFAGSHFGPKQMIKRQALLSDLSGLTHLL